MDRARVNTDTARLRLRLVRGAFLLSLGLAALICAAPQAQAQTDTEIQARRQLEFAKTEVKAGNFQRAITSSAAAFRLDPTLYDALVYKALAYEGMGELRRAEALLTTYVDLRGDMDPDPEAATALGRISAAIEAVENTSPPDGESDASAGEGEASQDPEEAASAASGGEEAGSASSGQASEEEASGVPVEENGPAEGEQGASTGETDSGGGITSEPSAAWLEGLQLRQDRGLLRVQRDVGTSLLAGGAGLSAVGAILMVTSSAEFETRADAGDSTVQVAAVYSGGLGMVGSGIALALVGLPVTLDGALKLRKLGPANEIAQRPVARLGLGPEGLTLRF